MTQRFSEEVAIVTGGSRGIGLEISKTLAREGASVVIASVDEARGKAAVETITGHGGRADFFATDVTQRDQVARLVEHTLKRFGGVHVLVNNAAVHDSAPFWAESEALWDRMYRVNVLGTALPSQLVVRHMLEGGGGAIVHVASKGGRGG